MKKKLTFFLLLILASFVMAKEKPKVAVVDFKEIASKVSGVGAFAANKVSDLCSTIKTINVIDRDHLKQILKEQNFSLTGIVENFDQNKVGKISGLNYLIVGDVSQCSVTRKFHEYTKKIKQKNGTYTSKKVKYWEWIGTGTIQLKIIDVVSGEILYSKTETDKVTKNEDYIPPKNNKGYSVQVVGEKTIITSKSETPQEDFNKTQPDLAFQALSKAVKKFRFDLYNLFRPTGYIIDITPYKGKKYKVLLDVGENFGIKKGNKFVVIQEGKTSIHPVTKEKIKGEDIVIGKIKIKGVSSETSYAIVDKKMGPKLKIGQVIKATKVSSWMIWK